MCKSIFLVIENEPSAEATLKCIVGVYSTKKLAENAVQIIKSKYDEKRRCFYHIIQIATDKMIGYKILVNDPGYECHKCGAYMSFDEVSWEYRCVDNLKDELFCYIEGHKCCNTDCDGYREEVYAHKCSNLIAYYTGDLT